MRSAGSVLIYDCHVEDLLRMKRLDSAFRSQVHHNQDPYPGYILRRAPSALDKSASMSFYIETSSLKIQNLLYHSGKVDLLRSCQAVYHDLGGDAEYPKSLFLLLDHGKMPCKDPKVLYYCPSPLTDIYK